MTKFERESNIHTKVMDSIVWKMFDILRKEIFSDEYHVVLFLLSVYKDDLISKDFEIESNFTTVKLLGQQYNSESELYNQYSPIIDYYEPIIKKLSKTVMKNLLDVFEQLDKQVLKENFSIVFDSVLYQISQSQGRFSGEFIQPIELSRFMCDLVDLKGNSNIFNPFAGLASFGVCFDQTQDYFGQELNHKTWVLGALRLMAYNRSYSSKYVCDDSILHWPNQSKKFDLIISNPPFGMRLGHFYGNIGSNSKTSDQFLIEKGVQSLKQNGKLITILPQGFLFKGMEDQRLREYLVEEDLIDTIIALPGGLLQNTSIPLFVLVLSKNKKQPGKVKFIDARNFVTSKGRKEKVLDNYRLSSFINNDQEDSQVIKIVSNEEIRHNNYNLSVSRYFQKKIDGVKLGDILELVRGQRGNLPEIGKLIRIRDLKDDKVDFTIDVSSLEESELKRPDIRIVAETCLLLATRWRTLKPTLFEFEEEPIFRSQDILSFKINETLVDKAYLINELHADYVLEQLESYRLGSAIPFIRKDDLMEVEIKLPSIEEQRAKVQGIQELSEEIKILQEERNTLVHRETVKEFNEFASLKHTLGRPRQNILDWSDNLLDFFSKKKENLEVLNKDFSEFYDIDIISALKEIKRDVNFITDVLEKGENGFVVSDYQKQLIPLSEINSIINDLSSNGFNFKIRKLLLKGEKLKERGIYANKTLFKTLLDNILTNANKYAFDEKTTSNEVVVELTEVEDFLSMEIKNNGKPFPNNFDREKFIAKYSTADSTNGSGLGGYDIHRIASDFNNPDWTLSLNEDLFFAVKFKFQFPIKLLN